MDRVKERNDDFLLVLSSKKTVYKKGESLIFTGKLYYRGDIITRIMIVDSKKPMIIGTGYLGVKRVDKEKYEGSLIERLLDNPLKGKGFSPMAQESPHER